MMPSLTFECESWRLCRPLTISRGTLAAIDVIVVRAAGNGVEGWAECFPTDRFGESVESVEVQLREFEKSKPGSLNGNAVRELLPAGAARNAVDCALLDLEARAAESTVGALLHLPATTRAETAITLGIDTPENMAATARRYADYPILKLKLGGGDDDRCVAAVREAAPHVRIVVDVNEGWSPQELRDLLPVMAKFGVSMVEQPVSPADDEVLADIEHVVPICADEACRVSDDVPRVATHYDMINVKLDKCGGLSAARELVAVARAAGLRIMIGANMGTGLGVAATMTMAGVADLCDLDAALWLATDRPGSVRYDGAIVHAATPGFWGGTSPGRRAPGLRQRTSDSGH